MEPNEDFDDYRSKLDEGTHIEWKNMILFPRVYLGGLNIGPNMTSRTCLNLVACSDHPSQNPSNLFSFFISFIFPSDQTTEFSFFVYLFIFGIKLCWILFVLFKKDNPATTAHPWCNSHCISINACGVWGTRVGIQVFRRELHIYIHLD